VVGLVGFLFATGRLNKERVGQVAEVLRGEYPASQPAATSQPTTQEAPPQRTGQEIAAGQARREAMQLQSERLEQESAQRKSLGESLEVRVLRRLEEIQKRNETFEKQKKALQQQAEQEGFTQALEIYSGMDPKLAKDLLISKEKDADVVHLMTKMDPSRRKKIVNVCKTAEEKLWIRRILDQIQAQDSMSKPASGVDGP
jgi:flagellar motility protein MotE (MotC chaperone)